MNDPHHGRGQVVITQIWSPDEAALLGALKSRTPALARFLQRGHGQANLLYARLGSAARSIALVHEGGRRLRKPRLRDVRRHSAGRDGRQSMARHPLRSASFGQPALPATSGSTEVDHASACEHGTLVYHI